VATAAEDGDEQALTEAAAAVPQAATEFTTKLSDIAQRFADAGVPLGGSTTTP